MKAVLCLLVLLAPTADYTTKMISAKKAGKYETNSRYLEFAKTHPLAAVINPEMKLLVTNEQKKWVAQVIVDQKERGQIVEPWSQEIGMEAVRVTPRLASIIMTTEGYTGGAHGYHYVETHNYGVVNGKARKLKLQDFFDPSVQVGPFISKLVIAKLKKEEGAMWVQNGEFKKLEPNQLQRFSVGADGLTWYFNPYEVGPYSAGDFEVKLSLKELGPKFKMVN